MEKGIKILAFSHVAGDLEALKALSAKSREIQGLTAAVCSGNLLGSCFVDRENDQWVRALSYFTHRVKVESVHNLGEALSIFSRNEEKEYPKDLVAAATEYLDLAKEYSLRAATRYEQIKGVLMGFPPGMANVHLVPGFTDTTDYFSVLGYFNLHHPNNGLTEIAGLEAAGRGGIGNVIAADIPPTLRIPFGKSAFQELEDLSPDIAVLSVNPFMREFVPYLASGNRPDLIVYGDANAFAVRKIEPPSRKTIMAVCPGRLADEGSYAIIEGQILNEDTLDAVDVKRCTL